MALNQIKGLHNNILIKTALVLIAFTFIWGLGDFNNFASQNYVAKVGNKKITTQEFQQNYEYFLKNYGQVFSGLSKDDLKNFGVDKIVMKNIITERLKDNLVSDLGLLVSDQTIANFTKKNPNFFTDNKFDINKFNQILLDNNMNEQQFIELSKENLGRNTLINTLAQDITPSQYLNKLLYSYYFEKKTFDVFEISEATDNSTPSKEDIEKYYLNNKSKYMEPTKREIMYLEVQDNQNGKIEVSEQEIKDYYNNNIDQFIKPEARDFTAFSTSSKEEAERASNLNFSELTKNNQLRSKKFELVYKNNLESETLNAVFNTPMNKVSVPFKIDNEWWVVVPTRTYLPTKKSLDQANSQILELISKDRQSKNYSELLNKVEDLISSGYNIEEIAKKFNYTVQKLDLTQQNQKLPAKFIELIFKQESLETEFISIDSKNYVYKILKIIPEQEQPLDRIYNQLVIDYKKLNSKEQLKDFAEMFYKSLSDDKKAVTNNYKFNIKTYFNQALLRVDLMNDFKFDTLPTELIKAVSTSNDDKLMKELNGKIYIVKINKTKLADDYNQDKLNFIQNNLSNDYVQIINQEIADYASKIYKVEVNPGFNL
jgi:hypothetical protein